RVAQFVAFEDRSGPATAGTQHVAVTEATAGDEAGEILQPRAPGDQVAHVHVERIETGAVERHRGLDLAVDALLAQDRHLGPYAGRDVRRGDVSGRIEPEFRAQPRRIEPTRRFTLLVGALGVVA